MKENDGTWCVDCGCSIGEHDETGCTAADAGVYFSCRCRLTPQGVRDASDAAANEPWE